MSEQTERPQRVIRNGYPAGVTCWVDVEVPDPAAATDFYSGLFGWELTEKMPDDAPGSYIEATIDGHPVAAIGSQADPAAPPAWNTYVAVTDADETAERIRSAGGTVIGEPMDVMKAGRLAMATDPEGAHFRVWQAGEHKGAEIVNEYGAWVFSGLFTGDVDAAAKFYGDVFGWTLGGDEDWSFFMVPGYGDHLEKLIPDLREKLVEGDAPKGFEDVTASVAPLSMLPDGTPPNWSVTFGIEDADAGAAKAEELGGKVLVPPFDAPPVRNAVISDPQGAVLTISRYYGPGERD